MANFNEQTAKEFLQRTMTVVGSSAAIEGQNREFLTRYATVVDSKDAIAIVAPEKPATVDEQEQTGTTGEQGQTGSTGSDAGAGEGTDNQGD